MQDDDQISVDALSVDTRQLFFRIVDRWKLFVAYGVVASALLASLVAFTALNSNKIARQDIRLFGIDERYPNDIPFNITDFIEPQILKELFETAGLHDIDPETYLDIVSISHSRRDTAFIIADYNIKAEMISQRAEDSKAQIQQLAVEREEALRKANDGIYTLQVDYEEHGISKETAIVMLDQWPKIWDRHVVGQYRVLTDLSLRAMVLIEGQDLSRPESAYYARQQLDYISGNLNKFSSDRRFRRLQSSFGRTPDEVLNALGEFDLVLFTPLYSSVLSIDSPLSEFYLSDQKLRIEQLDKQIVSLQSIVDDVTTMEIGVRSRASSQARDQADIIQIGDGTLNDIVGLVQKASLQEFLTSTLERRHSLVVEKTEIEKSLQQVKSNNLLSEEFIADVTSIYNRFIDEYDELLIQAEQLALDSHLTMFDVKTDVGFTGSRTHPKVHMWPFIPASGLLLLMLVMACIPTARERAEA